MWADSVGMQDWAGASALFETTLQPNTASRPFRSLPMVRDAGRPEVVQEDVGAGFPADRLRLGIPSNPATTLGSSIASTCSCIPIRASFRTSPRSTCAASTDAMCSDPSTADGWECEEAERRYPSRADGERRAAMRRRAVSASSASSLALDME